jgi:hypothetical protein
MYTKEPEAFGTGWCILDPNGIYLITARDEAQADIILLHLNR